MLKSIATAGLLAALAAAPLTSAQADVIFSVTQVGPTVVGPNTMSTRKDAPFTTNLQVIVTDEAAAKGFAYNIGRRGSSAPPPSGPAQIEGLVGILFQVFYQNMVEFSFTLNDFLTSPIPTYEYGFSVNAAAGGLLSGGVYGNDAETDVTLALNGTSAVSGVLNSDRLNLVCTTGNCTFDAVQTRTAVPEPMSIALFGAGLAGLAMVRRRKA